MKKQNLILSAALVAVFSASTAFAEAEVTGKIVHESAKFTTSGIGIGAATTSIQTADSHGKDVMKTETSARIYIDGEADTLQEGATYHVELNLMRDSKGLGDYDSNESYTQRDALREAYVDAETNGYSIRAGKQQVVWGTADGMKLLDAINPTDYSEMAQNQMEDSRIPVWMVNAETDAADGGNWQFIVSESKSSRFAGMGKDYAVGTIHSNPTQGHAFTMKGVDTITGEVNGMLNVVPAMGAVAKTFDTLGNASVMTSASVDSFMLSDTGQAAAFRSICHGGTMQPGSGDNTTPSCLNAVVNNLALETGANFGTNNAYAQNLLSDTTAAGSDDVTQWNAGKANPTQAFHYMPDATFATFDQFVSATSLYKVDHDSTPTLSARYKNATADGVNYSMNLIHGNDTNPYIDTYWTKSGTNTVLVETAQNNGTYTTNNLGDGQQVGGDYGTAGATHGVFNMVEKLNKITQLGGSFDTAIETTSLGPVVLRGEALYQKDVMSPVVTRKATNNEDLNHGFLVKGLKMEKGDRFKFVLGADITMLTNMLVSAQIIQDRNLDYVDVGNSSATDWKYTADMATMHLTNNLNKAEENKEFYSLFFSKPFGASGEHRWNNITMYEENGGKWNRLDAEFSIDDDTQATVEYNKYWGNENTQFGQLEKSSNIQVGVKYSF
ncbi:RNA polymerase-associated protein rapA [Candidatus Thioglobus sp.]|nr:RNA polymerase-associated protein rapA [Candidatus Thioglobus sp.]